MLRQASEIGDGWDRTRDGAFEQTMPPRTLAQALDRWSDPLTVTCAVEAGRITWEVRDGDLRVAGPFPDLDAAKRAGDRVIAFGEVDFPCAIVREVGLDQEVWLLEVEGGVCRFENVLEPDVRIELTREGCTLHTDDDPDGTAYDSVADAAYAVTSSSLLYA